LTAAISAPAPSRLACYQQHPVQYTQHTGILSRPQDPSTNGLSVVTPLSPNTSDSESSRAPYTATRPTSIDAALSTPSESPYPPPFSSLYFPSRDSDDQRNKACETSQDESPPAFAAAPPFTASSSSAAAAAAAETKAALPRDTKDGSSSKDIDDGEPPPPYSEGDSPLDSFTYLMASAGGPASIITQVSQTSVGPPINTLGGSDENITLELRYIAISPPTTDDEC
jgi:ATP-binding cassette subfamily F protein 3